VNFDDDGRSKQWKDVVPTRVETVCGVHWVNSEHHVAGFGVIIGNNPSGTNRIN